MMEWIILFLLWTLYVSLHSLLAAQGVKDWASARMGKAYRYYRIFYNVFAVLSFAGIIAYQVMLPKVRLVASSGFLDISGGILMICGGAVGAISFYRYSIGEFTGLQQAKDQAGHPPHLVTNGLNRYVRHPLYFGTLLILFGYLMMSFTDVSLVFVGVMLVYLVVGTRLEEKKLEKAFGQAYIDYKKRVKMLIPFIF